METTSNDNIFQFIKRQELNYKRPIPLNGKQWNMPDHIRQSSLYKNGDILGNKTDYTPVKNITRPILNLQYRTEDIDVKDVQLYVNNSEKYHLSFLVKKYHDDVFVVENDLDTFIDELNISRVDYGGALSKKVSKRFREVVPLESIVFCDQTDILSGPIGIEHYYSPDQLLEMASVGWGDKNKGATATLEETIKLSREEKKDDKDNSTAETPGRYIRAIEVHGNLPKRYADQYDTSEKYETRLWIVCFYQKQNSPDQEGIILYSALETESPFKLCRRGDGVYGRALDFGGAEEIFEDQAWVNYDMIRMQDMLDAASKTILKTTDPTLAAKHRSGLKDLDNLEMLELMEGRDVNQLDTFPRNISLFEKSVNAWEIHARDMGGAQESLQGKEPTAGTPFASLQEQVRQGMGLHEYRRGKFAKHLEEIYKDDFIPQIQKKITEGSKFLSELSLKELQYVSDCLVRGEYKKYADSLVFSGENPPTPEEKQAFEQKIRDDFKKKGNKHFVDILKGEFKDSPLAVKINIAGKQRNLAAMTDKIVNIWKFAFSNPDGFAKVMQIPGMAEGFNDIIEFSGLSPVDFVGVEKMAQPTTQPAPQLPAQPVMA